MVIVRLCAWHPTYVGRPKLLGIAFDWRWRWQVSHGICLSCADHMAARSILHHVVTTLRGPEYVSRERLAQLAAAVERALDHVRRLARPAPAEAQP